MKIVMRVSLASAILIALGICVNAQPSNPNKIFVAVFDFDARAGIGQGEAASLSDIFSSQLAQTGKYILVERNGIKRILSEQGFQQSDACSSVECLVEVGKILKVEKIFSGTIGKIGKLYTVSIQLINVSTGQIEMSKGRQHEGEIEDLATTIIPEMASEMTKMLTGQDVEMYETISSRSDFKRHEIELGLGTGPRSKAQIFEWQNAIPGLAEQVRVRPKSVFHIAYHFSFSPYFSLGLRLTSFNQTIENLPVPQQLSMSSPIVVLTGSQTIKINCNALSLEGRLNFLRGTIEPYGTLSLGLAFGYISGSGSGSSLPQQNFDGPALGFGLGSKFHLTNHFGLTLDLRILGISAGYQAETPLAYHFSSNKFDGSYNAAFLILFYQF
jgi:hypothetical protein